MTFNVEQEVHDVLNRLKAIEGKYHVLYSYALYRQYTINWILACYFHQTIMTITRYMREAMDPKFDDVLMAVT